MSAPRARSFGRGRRPIGCRALADEDGMIRYRASTLDCAPCPLKPRCCPNTPARKVPRSIHEGARDLARTIAATDA